MTKLTRRDLFKLTAGGALGVLAPLSQRAVAAEQNGKVLTIAYNIVLPSWDPTFGPFAVNPTAPSLFKCVFDQYIDQDPDLKFKPGILTKWGRSDDKSQIWMEVRDGVLWQDGSKLTVEDVAWSLERAGDPKNGVITQNTWRKIGNYKIQGNRITADVLQYEPAIFGYMAFLTGYVLPRNAFEKVGAKAFGEQPVGSGPYIVDEFSRNAFVRLKSFPKYWGPKPAFDTVVIKFVTDATSRVAEIERGSSDVTVEIPYEEFDRLKKNPKLVTVANPITDIAMLFITNEEPMLDKNVRLALHYGIDKKKLVDRLLRGYGIPLDTLEAPPYMAYDPTIKVGYRPDEAKRLMAASGYSVAKPLKFTIQTTRGYKPKDYDMVQAIAGMWREIGVDANVEVYEVARHYELRVKHQLAPVAFFNWGNSTGDPRADTGGTMWGKSPNSAWRSADLDAMIEPLLIEKDEPKRIAGYKAVNRHIAEEGLVIPLFQYVQPIVYRKGIKVVPHTANYVLPQLVTGT